jgi:LPS export ABC transporter protein LptC
MLTRATWFAIILMACVLLLTSWYAASLSEIMPFIHGVSLTNRGQVLGARFIETNAAGQIEYSGSLAEAIENGDGSVSFSQLQGVSLLPGPLPWTLIAPTGGVNQSHKQILLEGGVRLSRPAAAHSPAILIETPSAILYPETKTVAGNEQIRFSEPGTRNVTTATGFSANFTTQVLSLLAHVESTYELPH